jgi:uncharacterized membrane protein YkoI
MRKFAMLSVINGLLAVVSFPALGADAIASTPVPEAQDSRDATVEDKVDLSQALELATTQVGGRVVDAKRGVHNGHSVWDVNLDRDGQPVRVWVDSDTGAIEIEKTQP